MKNIIPAIILLGFICFIIWISGLYRMIVGYPKDCDFKLPNQYLLVYNPSTKKYAIQFMHLDTYRHYLEQRSYGINDMAYAPTTFKDSCEAKGFAKLYFEQKEQEKEEQTFVNVNSYPAVTAQPNKIDTIYPCLTKNREVRFYNPVPINNEATWISVSWVLWYDNDILKIGRFECVPKDIEANKKRVLSEMNTLVCNYNKQLVK